MPQLRTPLIESDGVHRRLLGDEALMHVSSEIALAWLNARLNNRVQRVEVALDARGAQQAAVLFKNGHVLKAAFHKLRTDEFVATSMLIYDLPRKFE